MPASGIPVIIRLKIMIQKCKHILIRPFFIPLKRILTDIFLAKMVHKIVEDCAPLRSDL